MWWDERFASFDGAVVESDSQAKPAASKQLTAYISLESAYVRYAFQVNQASSSKYWYTQLAEDVPSSRVLAGLW